jgi:hypothetical protein
MTEDAERQISALMPADSTSLAKFREIIGGGVDVLIGRGLSPATAFEFRPTIESDKGQYVELAALLCNKPDEEEVPVVLLRPKKWNKRVVIWVHEAGKAGLYGSDGEPAPAVQQLLAFGSAVAGLDMLYQGEFLVDGKPPALPRRVDNKREFAGYTLGYNASLFAQRVHDVLSLVSFCRNYGNETPEISLAAFGSAGPWAAAARAQAGDAVARAAIDTGGFRFAKLDSISHLDFLAGGAKYGDLPAMLALGAPGELWLAGEGATAPDVVHAAYSSAGSGGKLATFDGPGDEKVAAAIRWLIRP